VKQEAFRHLITDAHDGIQGSIGLLENHGNLITPQVLQIRFGLLQQIDAPLLIFRIEKNDDLAAFYPPRLLDDAHHRTHGNALAATGLPHQAKGGAVIHHQADPIERTHDAFVGVKIGHQVFGLHKRCHRGPSSILKFISVTIMFDSTSERVRQSRKTIFRHASVTVVAIWDRTHPARHRLSGSRPTQTG
jgi:hypothetical protein